MWKAILERSNPLSQYLQFKNLDLTHAAKHINAACEGFKEDRDNFKSILNASTVMALKYGADSYFKPKRSRAKSKFFDETSYEFTFADAAENFKVNIYNVVYDHLISFFNHYFKDFLDIVVKFSCLDPSHHFSDNALKNIEQLGEIYSEDLNKNLLKGEFKSIRQLVKEHKGKETISRVEEILQMLIKSKTEGLYPNMVVLMKIFLSIPCSSATAERSFSRLKIIKTYLRSTMGQERLNGLALLSIERDLIVKIDIEKAIDRFARMKDRVAPFL